MCKQDTGRSLTCLRPEAAARRAVAAQMGQSAFTMMEIAICLAIIGIALVAIIGVLPIGMNAQQDNRQQTIIGQDSSVFMEDIRNGSLGGTDLTNYVYAITNYWTEYGPVGARNSTVVASGQNGYTYSSATLGTGYPYPMNVFPLTNNANIIGLMSTPEFIGPSDVGDADGQPIPSLYFGGISNHVVAYVYSISGSAVDKPPQDNPLMVQDSFSYRIYCVNTPMPIQTNEFLYATALRDPYTPPPISATPTIYFWNWAYWELPANASAPFSPPNPPWLVVPDFTLTMEPNAHEMRLTFEWPQLPNGDLGSGRQTFRTLVAGQLLNEPLFNPANPGTLWNTNLYVYQPQTFTNTP